MRLWLCGFLDDKESAVICSLFLLQRVTQTSCHAFVTFYVTLCRSVKKETPARQQMLKSSLSIPTLIF